jgi:hypothetical protein
MWRLRALARLAAKTALALAVALGIAAIQAPFRRDSFGDGLAVSCLALGGFLLVMAFMGGMSFGRAADARARAAALGRLPGLPTWAQRREDEPHETATAVFAFAGLALIGLGIALS